MDKEETGDMLESVSIQVDEDAVPLCPNCLEPCDPLDNYCRNCCIPSSQVGQLGVVC